MTLVEDRKTVLTPEEIIEAVARGFEIAMGGSPSPGCLAVLCAQASLETGNGKALHCFNFGNVKNSPDWGGQFCRYACDELVSAASAAIAKKLGPCTVQPWGDGRLMRVVVVPPHPWTEFRAFSSAADGGAEFVAFLATKDRYRKAWGKAFAGDARGFVHELKTAGYFTGPEASYTSAVVSISERLLPACQRLLQLGAGPLTDEDREHVNQIVALATDQFYFHRDEPDGEEFPLGAA